jgi:hypothetical protein
MKLTKKNLLVSAAVATFGIGMMGSASADTFASSILRINNFRLLHSSGVAFASTDFATLTGTNDAHATAALNGVFDNGVESRPILSGIQPDVPQQCVGVPCPPIGQNNFNRFGGPPPVPGNFGYADQRLQGSSIRVGATPAGATAQTRADASTNSNLQIASGNSDVGTSTTFSFRLGSADTMTIAFDATPYTAAFVSAGAGATSNANARLSWSINIIDFATNTSVFTFAPLELNALSNVSRTDGSTGLLAYDPGTIFGMVATTPLLSVGTTYQITIQHNTLANTLQQETEVPEPATLGIVAAGLLGMSLVRRRKG